MFDRIVYISDKDCEVKLKSDADISFNLMNLHIIFEDNDKKILGEVDDVKDGVVKVRFLGEITNRGLLGGVIRKPTLDASVRVIEDVEVPLVTGRDKRGYMLLGNSPFYAGKDVFIDVNAFFSNHFAVFGNSGSGKSCGISRIFQNMFEDERLFPYKSNIIMFDSSGEYYNAFKNLSSINPNYNYRFISTNEVEGLGEPLRVPIYLLNVDDMALLLNVTNHSQLPIIERMLKLAKIFNEDGVDSNAFKNHLIAKAIMTILYTNETAPNKRNEIFSIIASCSTPEFTLETEIKGVGYTRKFRDCFLIDQFGNFTESVLMTEYISSFIKEEYDSYEPKGNVFYDLDTLEKALNFTLISEGWLRNENTYGDSVTIKVRLHSLITGENAKYFEYKDFVTLEQFISSLLIVNGKKYQLVNINLDDVDDTFAKVIVKIYSRLIFSFAKTLGDRASIPFNLVVEEAHRYIQNDTDTFLIGYNIFDRIAKEGRKYGVILGLITQRPVEMSDTVISQCSNFLIFKMNHPADVDYIRKMVPNISDEIVEKQKTLQSGTCLAFGQGFKIPLIVKLEMPNPEPRSSNCDVVNIWDGNTNKKVEAEESDEEFVKRIEEEASKALEEKTTSVPTPAPVTNNETKEEASIPEVEVPVKEEQPVEEDAEEQDEEVTTDDDSDNDNENESESLSNDEEVDEDTVNDDSDEDEDDASEEIEDVEDDEESSEESNDDSMIIPVPESNTDNKNEESTAPVNPVAPIEVPEQNNSVEQPSAMPSMEDINNNILQGLNNMQNEVTPPVATQAKEAESGVVKPEINGSNLVSNINQESNALQEQTPLTPVVKADVTPPVNGPVPEVAPTLATPQVPPIPVSPIPDANVVVPTVNPPENAQTVNVNATLDSGNLTPNVKQEQQQPSIIIPSGQNVDSSILNGFGGQAQMADNQN